MEALAAAAKSQTETVCLLFGNPLNIAELLRSMLKKSKGEGSGWIVLATGWGLGVTASILPAVACGSQRPQ
jgi:glycerol uptake facilitator-like aquaporin